MLRTYSELMALSSYEDRYKYLRIGGLIGKDTFGGHRWLNQVLYKSDEWNDARDEVIIRDNGHDLGMFDDEYEIHGRIIVHHMNPISVEDILSRKPEVFDPLYLVCCSEQTHKAIHYGDADLLVKSYICRKPGDTDLW